MEARLSFGDKHEIIYTYAADGRKLRAEYRINNFAVVDRDDEFGEMDDIGLPLSDVATFGLRDTMVAGGGIIDLPVVPPFTTLTTRDYCGNYIYRNGTLERILTPTGYIEGDTLYHYIKDYQGNVRCVVRHDGTLVESNEYYPYGGLFSATASAQPCKYGSKELDRTNGLDLYDSEARWYDPLLGRTTTMDPLAEKYYSLSPYLWCAGNPLKFVDPSGEKIEISEDSSDDFRNDYRKAYDYLKEHQASFVIDELELSPSTFVVKETNNGSEFDSKANVIYWNPHLALITNTGYTLTSAELLSHEAAHALNYDNDPESTLNRGNTQDDQYGNLEDKKVIEGPEQSVAIKLNRVNEFNRTRTDHFGTSYYVQTPYSTVIEGVVVLGQINSNK